MSVSQANGMRLSRRRSDAPPAFPELFPTIHWAIVALKLSSHVSIRRRFCDRPAPSQRQDFVEGRAADQGWICPLCCCWLLLLLKGLSLSLSQLAVISLHSLPHPSPSSNPARGLGSTPWPMTAAPSTFVSSTTDRDSYGVGS